jgi:serine/threonine-protein kinase
MVTPIDPVLSATAFAALPANHEPTPPGSAAIRQGRPAKGLTQEWKPAFTVVAVLLVAALAVGVLLWANLEFGGSTPTTSVPAPVTGVTTAADTGGAVVSVGTTIATITAYDPDGDNVENDAEATLALADGNPATSWGTVCYSSKYLGGKRGIGVVVTFDGPLQKALTVDVESAPYQVTFYASDAETIPATIDEWGPALGATQFADTTDTVISPVPPTPARHMFIMLKELGKDDTCTDANPYRGRLGEIAIVN